MFDSGQWVIDTKKRATGTVLVVPEPERFWMIKDAVIPESPIETEAQENESCVFVGGKEGAQRLYYVNKLGLAIFMIWRYNIYTL